MNYDFPTPTKCHTTLRLSTPGSLVEVGELAEATGRDADAQARGYIPKSDKVLLASKLLEPGETQTLSFEAPKEPGIYPYVLHLPRTLAAYVRCTLRG